MLLNVQVSFSFLRDEFNSDEEEGEVWAAFCTLKRTSRVVEDFRCPACMRHKTTRASPESKKTDGQDTGPQELCVLDH